MTSIHVNNCVPLDSYLAWSSEQGDSDFDSNLLVTKHGIQDLRDLHVDVD